RFLIRLHLGQIETLERAVVEIEARLGEVLIPFRWATRAQGQASRVGAGAAGPRHRAPSVLDTAASGADRDAGAGGGRDRGPTRRGADPFSVGDPAADHDAGR